MSGTQSRIEPSRSWFSNTKVITQNALQKFQDDMKTAMSDPYQVVLRKTELPVSLLNERSKFARVHLLETVLDCIFAGQLLSFTEFSEGGKQG